MAGKHSAHPWRGLSVFRRAVTVLGMLVFGVVRFFREGPEWLIGLVLTAAAVVIFLVVAR